MQGELYRPKQQIPQVFVPIDIDGFERKHVNIYIAENVYWSPGYRRNKDDRKNRTLCPIYEKKHPFKSFFSNPYSPCEYYGYNDRWYPARVSVKSEKGEILASFQCRGNEHALEVFHEVRKQLGII